MNVYAETGNISLDVSPRSTTIGNSIQIRILNIPKGEATYTLIIGPQSGQGTARGTIQLTLQVNNTSCIVVNTVRTPWKSLPCPITNNFFTFTGSLDTNKIGATLTTTNSLRYTVSLSSNVSTVLTDSLESDFVITAPSTQTTQSFDFTSQPLSPNPAKLEDQITININVNDEGDFTPLIQKYKNNQDLSGTKKHCATGACSLTLTIPNDIASSTIDVGVKDFNGYTKTTQLSINNPNASPTSATLQITTVPAPTSTPVPSPTPIAPLFPCDTYVDITDTNKKIPAAELKQLIENERIKNPEYVDKKYQCDTVSTAVGSIPTDPAKFIKTIFTILLSMAGGWAVYLIITAGYMLMFSQGDAEGVKEARERITSAIVGLVFMLLSLVILRVIGVDIFALPTFSN